MEDEDTQQPGVTPEEAADEEIVGKDRPGRRQTGGEEPASPMNVSPAAFDPPAAAPNPPSPPRPAPPPDHVQRVFSADVQKIIERRLVRAGFKLQDREDLQQIVSEALLYMGDPPTDLEGCVKAAHAITRRQIADVRRQAFRRGEADAGLTEEADDHAQEDARELANGHHAQRLATVREAMTDGTLTERDAEMLSLKREGLTDAQIGEKLGVATQTVSNRIAMVRKTMRQKWQTRMAQLAALTLAVVIAVLAWRKREEVANFFHHPAPSPAPAPAPTRPEPEPSIPVAVQAAELRRQAKAACDDRDLRKCSDRLDAAAKLDPAGETQPTVRELRHKVEDSIREERPVNAKPGLPR
jgi:RNA polymerase sigma factor (sigma-70 family)